MQAKRESYSGSTASKCLIPVKPSSSSSAAGIGRSGASSVRPNIPATHTASGIMSLQAPSHALQLAVVSGQSQGAGAASHAFNSERSSNIFSFGGTKSKSSSNGVKSSAHDRKLHTSGGYAPVVVASTEKDSVRFRLCVEALSEGCISTFMHLFQLSHRDPLCVDRLSQQYFTIPDEELRWIKDELAAIETLKRQSEYGEVVSRCRSIADYFEAERDYEEAAKHYELALQNSIESLNLSLQLQAHEQFAAFFERREQYLDAMELYEGMHRLANASGDKDASQRATIALVRVYQTYGNRLQEQGQYNLAAAYCEKAAAVAKKGSQGKDEAKAYSALGDIHEQLGHLSKALGFQKTFHSIVQREKQAKEECAAVLRVASLEERLGHNEEAVQALHEALQLSQEQDDVEGICRATIQLGEVFKGRNDLEKAMSYFKESFHSAMQTKKQNFVDNARVAIGFAQGEYFFKNAGQGTGYLPIVCNDIKAQLLWMSNGKL